MHWPKSDADHLIVTARQMVDLEEKILSSGLPIEALMEKVGQKMSIWLLKNSNLSTKEVCVIVGPGHNGGDGLVVARELHLSGVKVSIWCPFTLKKPLTIKYYSYAKWLGLKELTHAPDIAGEELWIDALFGLGQTRPLPIEIANLLKAREDKRPGRLVSLDVPSGICADSGKPFDNGAAVASFTLTAGFFKRGLLQDKALPYVGKLVRIDFGFSEKVLRQLNLHSKFRISSADVDSFNWSLPSKIASKYQRGRLLIIAGSIKYPGAAALTVKGALASGAGYIKAAFPKAIAESYWQKVPEIVFPGHLEISPRGSTHIGNFLKEVNLDRLDAIVIGPGLGASEENWSDISLRLKEFSGIIIFDADALNRISDSKEGWEWLKSRRGTTLITPHLDEFKRLFRHIDCSIPLEAASQAALSSGCGVLLKGAHSIFADPLGNNWQIGESAPWVARAGLGDVLAGFLGGIASIDSAVNNKINWEMLAAATLVHSESARNCVTGSTASSIAEYLSSYVKKINATEYLERDI